MFLWREGLGNYGTSRSHGSDSPNPLILERSNQTPGWGVIGHPPKLDPGASPVASFLVHRGEIRPGREDRA